MGSASASWRTLMAPAMMPPPSGAGTTGPCRVLVQGRSTLGVDERVLIYVNIGRVREHAIPDPATSSPAPTAHFRLFARRRTPAMNDDVKTRRKAPLETRN